VQRDVRVALDVRGLNRFNGVIETVLKGTKMPSSTQRAGKKLTISIDDQELTTRDDDLDTSVMLRLAGRDPEKYDLARVNAKGGLEVFRDGQVLDLREGDKFVSVTFGVKVNGVFVEFESRKQTGASIKAAAIAQGVGIQPDFVLSKLLKDGEHVIADDTKITVKHNDEFWAIPGDDNS
jgi:DNA-directed RNA polymerase alpha subunit